MKTEISIPNPIYRSAEKLAKELSVPLSELFTAALTAYLAAHEKKYVGENADNIYAAEPTTMESELVKIQIAAELGAWEAASDEALENFEKGLDKT